MSATRTAAAPADGRVRDGRDGHACRHVFRRQRPGLELCQHNLQHRTRFDASAFAARAPAAVCCCAHRSLSRYRLQTRLAARPHRELASGRKLCCIGELQLDLTGAEAGHGRLHVHGQKTKLAACVHHRHGVQDHDDMYGRPAQASTTDTHLQDAATGVQESCDGSILVMGQIAHVLVLQGGDACMSAGTLVTVRSQSMTQDGAGSVRKLRAPAHLLPCGGDGTSDGRHHELLPGVCHRAVQITNAECLNKTLQGCHNAYL